MATYLNKPVKPGKGKAPSTKPNKMVPVDTCCCPSVVVYLVETDCLKINNTACPDFLVNSYLKKTRGEDE